MAAGAITRDTAISLGLFITVLTGVAGGAVWATKLNGRLESIEEKLTVLVDDHSLFITRDAFAGWVDVLKAKNPDLNVPEIR